MRKLVRAAVAVLSLLALVLVATPAMADLCFNCGSGSSNGCKQCRSRSGKDTQQDRKICKDMGCKITGYGSCSTAANVKVCRAPTNGPIAAADYFPWHGME
jgi:hypothetical protein